MVSYKYINDLFTEKVISNEKDILYNKDKFDSGMINLCFITGFCGSGKSTLGRDLSKDKIHHYELDDVLMNWKFTDNQLKEYGDLINSFFKGPGKKYRYHTEEDMKNCTNPLDDSGDNYDKFIISSFVEYSKQYAKSHKFDKYIVEGIQLLFFIEPESLKDYAVYIKGTSLATSTKRAVIRDHGDTKFRASYISSYIKRTKHWKHNETLMKKYVTYFKNLMKEIKEVTEACKDLGEARKLASEVRDLAAKYNANFYFITDGASSTNNDGTNNAVKYARDTMKKWETRHGFDANEDWSKNE